MIDKQLKAMMDKKGLTLEKLSMLSNVPIETIRNIIYRRARNPRVDTLLALSRTLDVSMESLMGESPREEEEQLLFAYRESGEHGKKFIRAIAEIEAQWQAGVDVNEEREIPCLIPAVETSDGAAFSSFDVEHVKTACENVYMGCVFQTIIFHRDIVKMMFYCYQINFQMREKMHCFYIIIVCTFANSIFQKKDMH